jgi:hypothetical protein
MSIRILRQANVTGEHVVGGVGGLETGSHDFAIPVEQEDNRARSIEFSAG